MPVNLVARLIWIFILLRCQFGYSQFFNDPCTNHNGITDDEIDCVLEDWPRNLNLASVNRTHKCYVSCILMYVNLVDNYGQIKLDQYFKSGVIDEYAFAPTLHRCHSEFRNG
ncbi:hypothetical protein M5D96_008428, partial [Drosophila gunungcola]